MMNGQYNNPNNRKIGEQYSWASFLPYTVEFRGDQWCTWSVIAMWSAVAYGVFDVIAAATLTLGNMGFIIFLTFLITAFIFATAALGTFQLHKARGVARTAGLDPKTAAPRGWVVSIILTVAGAFGVLSWGGGVLAMIG